MCINAFIDDSTSKVTYQMKSTLGFDRLGWMAVGFGSQMPNTPMIITWPNADGSITISARQSTGHTMPITNWNPAQVATLAYEHSILASNSTTIAFDYPLPQNRNSVDMIFAYAIIRPASSAVDAVLQQHQESGPFTMDLTQNVNALPEGSFSTAVVGSSTILRSTPTGGGLVSSTAGPDYGGAGGLTKDERSIRTHGILMSVGFLIILPLGIFLARFSRTLPFLKNKWFAGHIFIQLVLGGPIIFAGWAIGHSHVSPGDHYDDTHKRIGLVLLILYVVQLVWGGVIHWFKPKGWGATPTRVLEEDEKGDTTPPYRSPQTIDTSTISTPTSLSHYRKRLDPLSPAYHPSPLPTQNRYSAATRRPIQNYLHAINGLVIIGLAFHNVREGYHEEWEKVFGLTDDTPFLEGLNRWWIAWVIIIPGVYVLGVTLLPRQFRMEDEARARVTGESLPNGAQRL